MRTNYLPKPKNLPIVYKLTMTDMTGVGGPMGSARAEVFNTLYFTTAKKAMDMAEKHFRHNRPDEKLKWRKTPNKERWTTGDLGWIMYDVEIVKVMS